MIEPSWEALKVRLSNLTVKQLRVLTSSWFVGDMGGATTKADIIHIMLIQMASWYRAPEQIGHGRITNVLADLAKVERGELW